MTINSVAIKINTSPLYPEPYSDLFGKNIEKKTSRRGTFTDNMRSPIHRWYRYSAGFSGEWVESLLKKQAEERKLTVLDPFAGSGTSLLASQATGWASIGFEAHPFVYKIASAKINWNICPETFLNALHDLLLKATTIKDTPEAPDLLLKCYEPDVLDMLLKLRTAFLESTKGTPADELVWLCLTSILRECSYVGTAQWQYLLPNKRKAKTKTPDIALKEKARLMYLDMMYAQRHYILNEDAVMHLTDARKPNIRNKHVADIVVTSPPYPNNYDYADATRLEMTFWGEINSWSDLQPKVRQYLVRACSQHTAAEKLELEELLSHPFLDPIRPSITRVCEELSRVRLEKGGKKTYHTMIGAYFIDLATVWASLRSFTKKGGTAYFVIGDSAPYGVHVPCEQWLGELALSQGFRNFSFEKIRDRNTKWKNRKHTVPLKEGILTVSG